MTGGREGEWGPVHRSSGSTACVHEGTPKKGTPPIAQNLRPCLSSPERTPGISQGTTAGYDFCKVPARSRRWESAGGVRLFG